MRDHMQSNPPAAVREREYVCALLAVRIPRYPNSGALFAHRRGCYRPGVRRNRYGLIDPQQETFCLRLDAVQVVPQPGENEIDPPAFGPDIGFANVGERGEPRFGGNGRLDLTSYRRAN
jgi:hypothetical protein